jgi:restriction system protein
MGYGGSVEEAARVVGKSGDGGIDGIIKEDKLGLDIIYVQAKRWENVVGASSVRDFSGSLDYHGAKKGVFITTSQFTKDAREFVTRIGEKKVVLVDGFELAQLMIDHDIGVSTVTTYTIKRLDSDYFEE